jgi:hypothetical protein
MQVNDGVFDVFLSEIIWILNFIVYPAIIIYDPRYKTIKDGTWAIHKKTAKYLNYTSSNECAWGTGTTKQ